MELSRYIRSEEDRNSSLTSTTAFATGCSAWAPACGQQEGCSGCALPSWRETQGWRDAEQTLIREFREEPGVVPEDLMLLGQVKEIAVGAIILAAIACAARNSWGIRNCAVVLAVLRIRVAARWICGVGAASIKP